jgi:uncharacterized spore protein YtfJ
VKIEEMIDEAGSSISAKRVFGEPYEKNGVTVIPVARVMGGVAGGGATAPAGEDSDEDDYGSSSGSGAGYGMIAHPAGAFVVRAEKVSWLPAIDVNRIIFGGQIVAIVALLVMRSVLKARAKAGIA